MILKEDCYLKDNCKKFKNNTCTEDFCIRLFNTDTLYNKAQLSDSQKLPTFLELEFDDPDEKAFSRLGWINKNIKDYVEKGNNLYIHSSICGNGKTAWAIKLLQSYINEVWPESTECRALFISVPRFLLALKSNISEPNKYARDVLSCVFDADLVVWDEVGIKDLTTYEHEQLLNFINVRLDSGKSNIYTSNLDTEKLKSVIGERLYSRIVNKSEEIVFYGQDKRGLL